MRICEAFEYEFLTSTLNSFIFGTSSTGKVGQTWLARSSFALDDSNKAFASSIKRPVSANLVLYLVLGEQSIRLLQLIVDPIVYIIMAKELKLILRYTLKEQL